MAATLGVRRLFVTSNLYACRAEDVSSLAGEAMLRVFKSFLSLGASTFVQPDTKSLDSLCRNFAK